MKNEDFDAIVIGSGFGGSIAALTIAREFFLQSKKDPHATKRKVLLLERGTWWTTPVGTVRDPKVEVFEKLQHNGQPVQFWSSNNAFRGAVDILTRILRRERNVDGLLEFTRFGSTGFLGFLRRKNDGVSVLRACGVGGGSLVYSNITIQPPNLAFNDKRWDGLAHWKANLEDYYDAAREAIGVGILKTLNMRELKAVNKVGEGDPMAPVINTGLSKIVTRSAGFAPHWRIVNGADGKDVYQINPNRTKPDHDFANELWIDRARVFQQGMLKVAASPSLSAEVGAHDLSINDFDTSEGGSNLYFGGKAQNYCERQGRCNVGCLPGARHTLNKQLMQALYGNLHDAAGPLYEHLEVRALCEADHVAKRSDGTYEVNYWQHGKQNKKFWRTKKRRQATTPMLVLSAGCLGTNQLLLKSRQVKKLTGLSECLGEGFSTNGDHIAFLTDTDELVRSTRGPVQTTHAHFNLNDPGNTDDEQNRFHSIEDLGIPPALATLVGFGAPLFNLLASGKSKIVALGFTLLCYFFKRLWNFLKAPFANRLERQDIYRNDDEIMSRTMIVTTTGREQSLGKFSLGGFMETPLRLLRSDGKRFHEDPVYKNIEATLGLMSNQFAPKNPYGFVKPGKKNISLSHPLGGCAIGTTSDDGVVDEYGRVFDTEKKGSDSPFHRGLYVCDASVIPTAIGVNPSLTISALAMQIAEQLQRDLRQPVV